MLLSLESAKSWGDIVTGSITAGVLFLGGLAAFWRFFLQRPLGNHWDVGLGPCRLREAGGQWSYILTITVENRSAAGQKIRAWWRQILFPGEVADDYDPNAHLDVTWSDAPAHYGRESLVDDYPLAPGEKYGDQMARPCEGAVQELCYVEFTLGYNEWRWHPIPRRNPSEKRWQWLPIPWRKPGQISQIMIAPVERDDLAAVSPSPHLAAE